MLRGECFRVPIYEDSAGRLSTLKTRKSALKKLLIVDPARFQHIVEDNQLIGWRYSGFGPRTPLASQVFLPEEVWFEKLPNPFDFWRGLAPLYVASMAARTDFAASAFMQGIIENNGDTGVIVRTDKWLGEEQRQQIISALTDRKRKAGQADRPVLLLGSAEVLKPQLSSSDLQFLENRKFSRAEICAAFGVPEEIVTTTDHAKYDVMTGARLNFIENRVAPLCCRLEAEEEVVVKSIDPRASGWFDLDSLPIMQEARRNRLAAARAGFEMGVPFNELNRVLDLGFKALPWGDRGYIGSKLQEVSNPHLGSGVKDHPPAAPELPEAHDSSCSRSSSDEPFARAHDLLANLRILSPSPQLTSKLRRFFFEQRGRALANLPPWLANIESARATPGSAPVLDMAAETANLSAQLHPVLATEFASALAAAQEQLGPTTFVATESLCRKYVEARRSEFGQVNQTTLAALTQSLHEGLASNETHDELTARIKSIFNAAMHRAEQIADAETLAMFQAARSALIHLTPSPAGSAGVTTANS